MSTSPQSVNPSQVLGHPDEWKEITLNQAMLYATFVPVIRLITVGARLEAEIFKMLSRIAGIPDPVAPPARYFIQVTPNKSTAAQGPVPATMDMSASGADFIRGWESVAGYDKKTQLYMPYDDKKPGNGPITPAHKVIGFPTIGYGHLIGSDENFDKGLTKAQIDDLFVQDAAPRIKGLNKILKMRASQPQFDAFLAFEFNTSVNGKLLLPPIRHFNAGKAVVEADFNTHYITSGGVKMGGLVKRRTAEWTLFSTGVYSWKH